MSFDKYKVRHYMQERIKSKQPPPSEQEIKRKLGHYLKDDKDELPPLLQPQASIF